MKKVLIDGINIKRRTIPAFVMLMLLVPFIAFESGAIYASSTTTIAQTTVSTVVQSTITTMITTTFNFTEIVVRSTTSYQVVTDTGPKNVTITGTIKTNAPGTVAASLSFIDTKTNQTMNAHVTNGAYSVVLPNHASFNVRLGYGTSAANIGAGSCSPGALVLYAIEPMQKADWVC